MPRSIENVNRVRALDPARLGWDQYTTICQIMPTYSKIRKAGTREDPCFPSHKEEKGVFALYYSLRSIQ